MSNNFKLDINSCEFRASSPAIAKFEPKLKTTQSTKDFVSQENSVEYNSDASTQADDCEVKSNTSSPQKTKEIIKIRKFDNTILADSYYQATLSKPRKQFKTEEERASFVRSY